MANVIMHPEGLKALLYDPAITGLLTDLGESVRTEAQATASSAEEGAGGRIDGYASAGFTVSYEARGKRPRVLIKSNADGDTITAAHFHTQKRDGVGHLRAALYKFTRRG